MWLYGYIGFLASRHGVSFVFSFENRKSGIHQSQVHLLAVTVDSCSQTLTQKNKTVTWLTDIQGGLVRAWHKQLRNDAFDHGLWIWAYKFFNDKTPANYVTFGSGPTDLLPGHLSGLLSRWSTCLANVLRKPTTLSDVHQAKKTVLDMDSGFDMLIPIVRYTHSRYNASRALSMNAPTQEAGMTIANTWEAFKDHKKCKLSMKALPSIVWVKNCSS
jgi:hypothetical protein